MKRCYICSTLLYLRKLYKDSDEYICKHCYYNGMSEDDAMIEEIKDNIGILHLAMEGEIDPSSAGDVFKNIIDKYIKKIENNYYIKINED